MSSEVTLVLQAVLRVLKTSTKHVQDCQIPRLWRPKMSPNQEMSHPRNMVHSISVEMLVEWEVTIFWLEPYVSSA